MTALVDLREAAEKLRAMANAAPKGPWTTEYFGDRGYPQRVTNAQATLIASTNEGGTGPRPIPEWIALMDPLVGLALADWLDSRAAYVAGRNAATAAAYPELADIGEGAAEHSEARALAVARLLLGRQP